MVTFIESPLFTKLVHDYLTDDEYRGFQTFLATNPDVGAVVRGSGGVRKVAGPAGEPARVAVSVCSISPGQNQAKSYCS
jgi:hypothetical protein